ncbi:hypothetical protein [Ascidiaceihabitans sp.]|uniref:DUF6902 family protein n=1 Tax=Ascidiaceihabitans sp. TaxID=1872644 RepID=UPI00329A1248
MTNIVTLNVPARRQTDQDQTSHLIAGFGQHRRGPDDVFWLKENAELLNILECTKANILPNALENHQEFYVGLKQRFAFFPQYYRFLLSICLDLEDLGYGGSQGEGLCDWVVRQGLPEAEVSDLQRAEARRLLARRGVDLKGDTGLTERLHRFIDRADTFALPNKKAAYELTHIVFYLSQYGRCDPKLSSSAIRGLRFAGVLAYLDQNADLLAEICIALRYANQTPPQVWEDWVMRTLSDFDVQTGHNVDVADDYHMFFVCGWLSRLKGGTAHNATIPEGRMRLTAATLPAGPLRSMSACLFQMEGSRSADWHKMRPVLEQSVDENGYLILQSAAQSIDEFDAFFEGFSRVSFAS